MSMTKSCHRAVLVAAMTAGIFVQAPSAKAAEPVLRASNPLARLFLPYSPYAFDLTVQIARSFAEVTYGQRSYDPITENFVVNDLRIRREGFDLLIARLRVGEAVMMAQGITLDTSELPLPPPLREGLRRLDRETVTADLVADLKRDDARSAMALDVALDMDGIGALTINGGVDNFHIMVPLSQMEGETSAPPVVSGFLTRASIAYRDGGLAQTVNAIVAEQQGVTADDMRNGLAVMPLASLDQLLASLPGGASMAFREQAMGWARVVEAFIRTPDAISVSVNPSEPFPLARLQGGIVDEATITALNPSIANGLTPPNVASLPAGPVEAAAALISGGAVVQDREGGARALLALASDGNIEAVARLGAIFGSDALPDLQPAELAGLYRFLLVGRALDAPVSDTTLSMLSTKLDPVSVRAAEISAAAYFREMTYAGRALTPLSAASITQFDASKLRAYAFDAYEGRGMTRDYTEAYAVALVAAATGDPLAATLRDNLATAFRDKRIVVSLDEARVRASVLWAAYSIPGAGTP